MIEIERYYSGLKLAWDTFNGQALNGTLLFYRDFMEYHAQRFTDFSLLFYHKNKLICLLPMNRTADVVTSHAGLTYGGLIFKKSLKSSLMLAVFEVLIPYLRDKKVEKLIYKAMPAFLRQEPAEADLFALYQWQGKIVDRALSSVIPLNASIGYSKARRWRFNQIPADLKVRQTSDYAGFMNILDALLRTKYEATATHNLSEIIYLVSKFPDKIKLYAAYFRAEMVGGTLILEHPQAAHVQYTATTAKGRELLALDLIMHTLISTYRAKKKYLSLGTSTNQGLYQLNHTLLQNKESYGARAVVQDTYQLLL